MPDSPLIESICAQWLEVRSYAERLVADLSDEDMVSQPVPGVVMNHAAWVLSHLSAYAPVLAGILRSEPVEDPIHSPFGKCSIPTLNTADYLSKNQLIQHFTTDYDDAISALIKAPTDILQTPNPIERWRTRFPFVSDLPIQFIIRHNALHLGQISAWRRAAGMPPV